jgi:hypothetical protein
MMIKLAIVLAIVLTVAAFAAWAFLPARYLPGKPRPPPAHSAAPAAAPAAAPR